MFGMRGAVVVWEGRRETQVSRVAVMSETIVESESEKCLFDRLYGSNVSSS